MRWLVTILMVLGLGLSACGKKGDLVRPGGEDDPDEAHLTQPQEDANFFA